MFFPMFRGSGGSKSRLAKAAGAKPSGEMRDEELHAVVKLRRRKSARRCCCPKHVWKSKYTSKDVWKLRCCAFAVVAQSMFRSQNVQSTPFSEHFWKLRCSKSARRCGAKHISKSNVLKTEGLGPLLEVRMRFCMAGARDSARKVMPVIRSDWTCHAKSS